MASSLSLDSGPVKRYPSAVASCVQLPGTMGAISTSYPWLRAKATPPASCSKRTADTVMSTPATRLSVFETWLLSTWGKPVSLRELVSHVTAVPGVERWVGESHDCRAHERNEEGKHVSVSPLFERNGYVWWP